jgi:hypothetical protein
LQTFDPEIQTRVSRRQDDDKALANLRRLVTETHAHVHADLIFGLPGETLESFARGFDRLVAVAPHEIQIGLLKRLRGAPIARHTVPFGLVFDVEPPYAVWSTSTADFGTVQRMVRFARYWDIIGNSGRFAVARPLLLGTSPFARFWSLSEGLYAATGRTHEIAYETLVDFVFDWSTSLGGVETEVARDALAADYARVGARGRPRCLEGRVDRRPKPDTSSKAAPFSQRQGRVAG